MTTVRSEFAEKNAGAPDRPLGAIRQGFPEEEAGEEARESLSKGIAQAQAKRPRPSSQGVNFFAVHSDSWCDSKHPAPALSLERGPSCLHTPPPHPQSPGWERSHCQWKNCWMPWNAIPCLPLIF